VASNKQQINWIGIVDVETTEKLGYLKLVSEWIRPKIAQLLLSRDRSIKMK